MNTKLLIAYALAFMVTFGHAMHTLQPPHCIDSCEDRKAAGALIAATFWPLYWSTKVWGIGIKGDAS